MVIPAFARRHSTVLLLAFITLAQRTHAAGSFAVNTAGKQQQATPADPPPRGYRIPLIDLSTQTERQVVVDREPGQYLGHPTTVLLEDGKTMLCVYPKGHGRGAIVYKRSSDGGRTWSERLPTPASWATSKEVPTLHRVVDAQGKKRLIVWSGLYPARLAVSEDDGRTWSELEPVGDWGGIVVMGSVVKLNTPGHYLALFHDDGRFLREKPQVKKPVEFTLYKTLSSDGGLTWTAPEAICSDTAVHLCEPCCIRSPDGKQLAVLLRENSRRRNSHVMFSNDEGRTWTRPRELPGSLTGDRHTGRYAPDGRLFISFRDTTLDSPTKGDWVAWVGTYDDIVHGREGQYRVRLMKNHKGADCAYPGVEVLPDGTMVTTTYGHWTAGESPYVVSVRLKLDELDRLARVSSQSPTSDAPARAAAGNAESEWLPGQEHRFDGYKVTLSRPVLVGRSRVWFPSLSRLSDGRVLAVMTDYADAHAKTSTARLAWSRDGGLTWSPLVQGRYGEPTLTRPNGDELLLPYYLRPRGDGVLGEAYQLLRRGQDKVELVESGVRVRGWPRPDRSFAPELGLAGFVFNGDTLVDRDGRHLAMLCGHFAGAKRYALVLAESGDGVDWQIGWQGRSLRRP
jgi:hypothetical protein